MISLNVSQSYIDDVWKSYLPVIYLNIIKINFACFYFFMWLLKNLKSHVWFACRSCCISVRQLVSPFPSPPPAHIKSSPESPFPFPGDGAGELSTQSGFCQ